MSVNDDERYAATGVGPIDWTDIKVGVFVGCVFAAIKGASLARPELDIGDLNALVPFLLCVEYTIYRARKNPEKLDEWGITTPITALAMAVMLTMTAAAIGCLAALGFTLSGSLSFEFIYLPKM
ncbi:MAG TPA: hypothetical protein ENN29_03285, partial [Candidatus Hydrogenedentes bacterium]|nr:hypothetical protein [Candidatus Hydrogenedentota bacterium]